MKRFIQLVTFSLLLALSGAVISSCSSKTHCVSVTGTGNSATKSNRSAKTKCSGVSSSGTTKPKVKRSQAKERGNFDPKMAKQMAKAKKKKAGPIKGERLSFDK